jgi:hypothetical protein
VRALAQVRFSPPAPPNPAPLIPRSIGWLTVCERRTACFPSLDGLLADIWSQLALVKIYTKKRGQPPDLTDPICMRKGSTIEVGLAAAVVVFAFDQGG